MLVYFICMCTYFTIALLLDRLQSMVCSAPGDLRHTKSAQLATYQRFGWSRQCSYTLLSQKIESPFETTTKNVRNERFDSKLHLLY